MKKRCEKCGKVVSVRAGGFELNINSVKTRYLLCDEHYGELSRLQGELLDAYMGRGFIDANIPTVH